MRKTYDVQMLKEYANEQLARTDEFADAKFKSGICNMIEHVLLKSNNYNGFQYIYWKNGGYAEWVKAGQPDFPEKYEYIYGNLGEYSRIYY